MTALTDDLARGRAAAVRTLLARPLLHEGDASDFRLVLAHRDWLVPWFDRVCGWRLHVDVRSGVARLHKRSDRPDATRPVVRPRRSRSARRPFDRRRYQLLCLVGADLVRRPATTISLLAAELESVTVADPALATFAPAQRQSERRAFVDALNRLASWGVLRTAAGEVADFVDDPEANAVIEVDQSRLHQLLASAQAPSMLAADAGEASPWQELDPVTALSAEPRYGAAARGDEDADEQQRNRWRRHRVARRLLDDPVVHLDELTEPEYAYLTSQAGRQWLRAQIAEAGFVLEERAEGWAAIDPDAIATDRLFPGPGDNVKQAALLLLDRLVEHDQTGQRRLVTRARAELADHLQMLMGRHTGWARQHRDDDGPAHLTDQAIGLLSELGLIRRDGEAVVPRPMLARYTSTPPRTDAPTLPGLDPGGQP